MGERVSAWLRNPVCLIVLALLLLVSATTAADVSEIALPKVKLTGKMSVEQALSRRRSVRRYADRALTLREMSQVLWAAQGATNERGFRTAPSAGALYPLELYVAVGKVEGLEAGLYRYLPDKHALHLVRMGDIRQRLFEKSLRQESVRKAPAVLVISSVTARTERKYGKRAERYVRMEVGAVCQNVYLQCETLGLGTVAVGAFHDHDIQVVLGEKPVPELIMPVGAKP